MKSPLERQAEIHHLRHLYLNSTPHDERDQRELDWLNGQVAEIDAEVRAAKAASSAALLVETPEEAAAARRAFLDQVAESDAARRARGDFDELVARANARAILEGK